MIKTSTFTTDAIGSPEPVTTTIRCRKIVIAPADGASDYVFRAPNASSTAITKFAGASTVIERPSPGQYQVGSYGDTGYYEAGETVAYVESVSGTITISMEESL